VNIFIYDDTENTREEDIYNILFDGQVYKNLETKGVLITPSDIAAIFYVDAFPSKDKPNQTTHSHL
jgi:hypothetical protein